MVGDIIEVKRGKLTFEFGEERIEFKLEKLMRSPSFRDSYCLVDVIDAYVQESASEPPSSKNIEVSLFERMKSHKNPKANKELMDHGPISHSLEALMKPSDEPSLKNPNLS